MNGASSALGRSFVVAPARARETNDGAVAREWAINGHGVVMKSIWDIGADLQAGRLQVLLPQWRTPDAPVHVFYQRTRYMAPRVRALLDFLVERFAQASRWRGSWRRICHPDSPAVPGDRP
jgi:DNA-binding transcriptional LysR family regulator